MPLPQRELTIAEAAVETKKSAATIQRAITSGALLAVKRGRHRLIPRDALNVWLRSRNELPADAAEVA